MSISTESERFNRFTIKQPKSYNWDPEKDITAYELALCMPVIIMPMKAFEIESQILMLPESAQRHFKEV